MPCFRTWYECPPPRRGRERARQELPRPLLLAIPSQSSQTLFQLRESSLRRRSRESSSAQGPEVIQKRLQAREARSTAPSGWACLCTSFAIAQPSRHDLPRSSTCVWRCVRCPGRGALSSSAQALSMARAVAWATRRASCAGDPRPTGSACTCSRQRGGRHGTRGAAERRRPSSQSDRTMKCPLVKRGGAV